MRKAIATEDRKPPQWVAALWASSCLHMIVVGALQPAPMAMEDRFSQRAIEVTLERPASPPALSVAMTETDSDDIRRDTPPDSAPGALAAALPPFGSVHWTKLDEAVVLSQPPPAVSAREPAPAAPDAAGPRPPDATDPIPQRPAQHKAIKPLTSAASTSASQRQALQDYVLQVVAKLSHTRFYALSQGARNGDGVVVARLTVARAFGTNRDGYYVHMFFWEAENDFSYLSADQTTGDFVKWMFEHGKSIAQISAVSRYNDVDYVTFRDDGNGRDCIGFRRLGKSKRGGYDSVTGGILCAPAGKGVAAGDIPTFIDRVRLQPAAD